MIHAKHSRPPPSVCTTPHHTTTHLAAAAGVLAPRCARIMMMIYGSSSYNIIQSNILCRSASAGQGWAELSWAELGWSGLLLLLLLLGRQVQLSGRLALTHTRPPKPKIKKWKRSQNACLPPCWGCSWWHHERLRGRFLFLFVFRKARREAKKKNKRKKAAGHVYIYHR